MTAEVFQKLYKQLNAHQKKAVDAIEGPVMVIAGPGTGKTQILTLRIANILQKTDIEPENILAITYTEAGVIAMRKRLSEIIGSKAYEITITTFHGFANNLIKQYPESLPRIIGARSMNDVDQIRIIESVVESAKNIKLLRPFGDRFHYVRDIIREIKNLKREGISPDDLEALVQEENRVFGDRDDVYHQKGPHKGKMKGDFQKLQKTIQKNAELAMFYRAYQERLTEEKLYDYEDMIMEALNALRSDPELLLILQENYQYVLVDEHQDTNRAQNLILEVLMSYHPNPNLFIVGDEKQAIFRFQGASLQNFLYFHAKYPESQLVALEDNYRSTQMILDSAASLMQARKASGNNLTSQKKHPEKPISVYELETTDSELYFVARHIQERIDNGTTPEEIAVLYRDNKDGLPLSNLFEKMAIPCRVESDLDVLADTDIRKLVTMLTAIDRYGEPQTLIPVLYIDTFQIEPLDVHRLVSQSALEKKDIYTALSSPDLLNEWKIGSQEEFHRVFDLLRTWKLMAENKNLLELFDHVVRESGLLASIIARPDATDGLEKLGVFLDQVRRLLATHEEATLRNFMEYLGRMKEYRLMIRGALSGRTPGKVRLMTAHRAKGLEFGQVYIINCFDGHWGNRYHIEKLKLLPGVYKLGEGSAPVADDDEDERNLFYVALTRAKHEVMITFAHHALDQREQLPSKFLSEIKPDLITWEDSSKYETAFQKNRQILFGAVAHKEPDLKDKDFIHDLFIRRGFAVTHLNNYLRCPWQYFFVNLLRIPQSPNKHMMYGTAIHHALQDLFERRDRDGEFSRDYVVERFAFHTNQQLFAPGDREEILEKGSKSLAGYYDTFVSSWRYKSLSEFAIKGVALTPEIILTGTIDRLDILNEKKMVSVTDYKTSSPKSRNEIEGKTRSGDGNYKRQLVFYNLLLNNYKEGMYDMESGSIDFIEPDEKGNYRREAFVVSPTEITELKELIEKTADEILNLSFWDRSCDDKDCEFCALRKMIA